MTVLPSEGGALRGRCVGDAQLVCAGDGAAEPVRLRALQPRRALQPFPAARAARSAHRSDERVAEEGSLGRLLSPVV